MTQTPSPTPAVAPAASEELEEALAGLPADEARSLLRSIAAQGGEAGFSPGAVAQAEGILTACAVAADGEEAFCSSCAAHLIDVATTGLIQRASRAGLWVDATPTGSCSRRVRRGYVTRGAIIAAQAARGI